MINSCLTIIMHSIRKPLIDIIRNRLSNNIKYNSIYSVINNEIKMQQKLCDPVPIADNFYFPNHRLLSYSNINLTNPYHDHELAVFNFINTVNDTNTSKPDIHEYCNAVILCLKTNKTSERLFKETCKTLIKNSIAIDTSSLVSIYKACQNKEDANELRISIMNQLLWNIPRMSLSNIIIVKNNLNQEHQDLIKLVEERYTYLQNNIVTVKDFLTLLYADDSLTYRAIDYVNNMNTKQLYRLGCILAKRSFRSKHLLRSYNSRLCTVLNSDQINQLSLIQYANLMKIYSSLNIYDKEVFDLLSDRIIDQLKCVSIYSFVK